MLATAQFSHTPTVFYWHVLAIVAKFQKLILQLLHKCKGWVSGCHKICNHNTFCALVVKVLMATNSLCKNIMLIFTPYTDK